MERAPLSFSVLQRARVRAKVHMMKRESTANHHKSSKNGNNISRQKGQHSTMYHRSNRVRSGRSSRALKSSKLLNVSNKKVVGCIVSDNVVAALWWMETSSLHPQCECVCVGGGSRAAVVLLLVA